jgi:conjugative relaxase-like TrwC/TraI family protein
VLRVGKVRQGGQAYYLDVATGGGGTGIEAAGVWMGRGSARLELSGTVEAAPLEAVLAGEDPTTGGVLGTARHRVRVAGFDLTFSAPKSVSLLHALGGPEVAEAVRAGHGCAVDAAVSYVERHALAVRRRAEVGGPPIPGPVDAVAAAGFVHRVSRALDPHLHTHVVVANLGRGEDGTWSALDGRGIYAHASATDALFHAHLRHELTRRLGVAWDPPDRGRADIAGIGAEARRAFSQRAADIAAHLAARGMTGGRAATVAALATRPDKERLLAPEDLRPGWEARARAVGLGPARIDAVLDRVPRRARVRAGADSAGREPPGDGPADREPPGTAARVAGELGALGRTVSRRDVVRAWCRSLPDGAPAPVVERAADRLLARLAPDPGPAGRRRGPGVAERRHEVEVPALGRGADERAAAELTRLLARRGVGLDRSDDRHRDVGRGLG